jgi:hypothetical protein
MNITANKLTLLASTLALISIGACGGGDDKTGSKTAASSGGSDNASAEEVAKDMRGKVRCPARSASRPAGAPVDDVVGIRPGMSWDEAANHAMCDNPLIVVTENSTRGYNINTYGQKVRQGFDAKFAEARVVRTSEQVMQDMADDAMRRGMNAYVAPLEPGQFRYFVSTMGMPGQEKVMSVSREEYFAAGKLPSVDDVKAALIGKYGEPSQVESNGAATYVWWNYAPNGEKLTATSPSYIGCRINVSPDAGTNLSTDCGLAIGALIQGANDNPGLAHSLAVTSQNGAEGYALLASTEETLKSGDRTRQTGEIDLAKKSAVKPKL